jgi:hypothetical protein
MLALVQKDQKDRHALKTKFKLVQPVKAPRGADFYAFYYQAGEEGKRRVFGMLAQKKTEKDKEFFFVHTFYPVCAEKPNGTLVFDGPFYKSILRKDPNRQERAGNKPTFLLSQAMTGRFLPINA